MSFIDLFAEGQHSSLHVLLCSSVGLRGGGTGGWGRGWAGLRLCANTVVRILNPVMNTCRDGGC